MLSPGIFLVRGGGEIVPHELQQAVLTITNVFQC
jgi:hypothetical protein